MKHFRMVRILAGVLFLLMIIPIALSSCGDGSNNSGNAVTEKNQSTDINPESEAVTESVITHDVPDIDFDGYDFNVMVRESYLGIYWVTNDVFAESQTGEPINDAVYIRNRLLEDKFNINIHEIIKGDMVGAVQMSIQAGDDDYDVCYPIIFSVGEFPI